MFKVDIKYCPWAPFGNHTSTASWEVLKEDIPTEEEAKAFADEVASKYSQCTVRITDDDDAFYETTIES